MTVFARSLLWSALLGAPGLVLAPSVAAAAALDCQALKGEHEGGILVETAEPLAAGPTSIPGMGGPPISAQLPATCKLTGVIDPRKAADGADYGVRFELR